MRGGRRLGASCRVTVPSSWNRTRGLLLRARLRRYNAIRAVVGYQQSVVLPHVFSVANPAGEMLDHLGIAFFLDQGCAVFHRFSQIRHGLRLGLVLANGRVILRLANFCPSQVIDQIVVRSRDMQQDLLERAYGWIQFVTCTYLRASLAPW